LSEIKYTVLVVQHIPAEFDETMYTT